MEVYRICSEEHANVITASGCENRWNRGSQMVIYGSGSRSLATLEMMVRRSSILPTLNTRLMVLSISEEASLIRQVQLEELPRNWRTMAGRSILQLIGASWYASKKSLVLKIPSVVIPQEFNYAINTIHPLFGECVKLIETENIF
jgi:RES domain-containing protein